MTDAIVTETVTNVDNGKTKAVAWHCVTDEHGEGCGATMGVIHFDPTRLTVSRDGEIVAIIRGDAEIRCPRCGKPQAWHWEQQHPAMKRISERNKD